MHEIKYKDNIIKYSIIKKSNIKNISIKVKYPGIVTVTSPSGISNSYINDLLKSKISWISDKLHEFDEINFNTKKLELIDGDNIYYLGNLYTLRINDDKFLSKNSIYLKEREFIVDISSHISISNRRNTIYELLKEWFITSGNEKIKERLNIYSKILNIYPENIKVKEQKTTWGNCSSLGNIYINWRIFLAPIDIIDYILVHELCHLKHMNHSKEFWNLVESVIPDYKNKREYLKNNSNKLKI